MTEKEWLNDNQLSIDIWRQKYQYDNETFDEWLDRVSGGNTDIRQLILEKKFLFGGRILANRGLDKKGKRITLSNCYVITPPEDNIESIFDCATKLARTYSYGGGCGVDVSKLRPKGSKVNNAASTTTGCTSFMDYFSYVTGLIGQEGRRGALMLSIDCTHPDLEEFINLKTDLDLCTKANISVRISDQFMHAVEYDEDWQLYFKSDTGEEIKKIVKAKEIFKLLAKRNWEMAEPGVLFWDNICKHNMLDKDASFKYAGTNPCAEEPLPAGGSCLLGSINLSEFVTHPFEQHTNIDFEALEDCVAKSIVALNQVLLEGMKLHPLKEQQNSVYNWRQIGLGTMGLGDMLIKLGVTYGSDASLEIINEVFETIAQTAVETSLQLAKTEGCYPMCNKEALVSSDFIQSLNLPTEILKEIREYGLFNSQLLTCAPTGSIGTMLQCSTGVEPNYAFAFNRRTQSLNGEETIYKVFAKIVEDYSDSRGRTISYENLPPYFVASQQIDPFDRIKVQAALQRYIDASISSTINLPESTTIEEVFDIYYEAWKQGLKGVTIYRDNCQRQGILSKSEGPKEDAGVDEPTGKEIVESSSLPRGFIRKANDNSIGLKRTLTTGCGTLHCTAYFDPVTGEFLEMYLSKGSTGGCNNFMISLSRMTSLAARGGVGIDAILDQLKSCGVCPSYAVRHATKKDTSPGSCCPVAVGKALREMYNEMQERLSFCEPLEGDDKIEQAEIHNETGQECPQCHHKTLIHTGGCISCTDCGWTKCN